MTTTQQRPTPPTPATPHPAVRPTRPRPGAFGLVVAVVSAAAFGTSGAFADSLLAIGWTPAAIVSARLAVAGVALLPAALWSARGRWSALARRLPLIGLYGLVAMAACQLFFYYAVSRLSIGVAMMLEYTSPLLLVTGFWIATRIRPRTPTLVGCVVAMGGLALVLDAFSGLRIDGLGVLFGLLAAAGNASFFLISGRVDEDLPPLALAAGGLLVGAVVLALAGLAGLAPFRAVTGTVTLAGAALPWWVPVLGVALVAAALAYVSGIFATRILGSTVAAFVGLSEVLFAVLWGWLLVGQSPRPVQALGGLVMLAGVVAIKVDDARHGGVGPAQEAVPNVTSAVREEPPLT